MEERRQSQSQSTVEGDPASFSEMEITQQVLGHQSGYLRELGWGPRSATFGQCSGTNKESPVTDELETQRDQLETQRVQLETQQEYILGVLNNLSPQPQMPAVPQQPGLEATTSESSRDPPLPPSDP